LFVATQNSLTALDMGVFETRPTFTLLQGTPVTDFWIDSQGKRLYFFDSAPGDTPRDLYELPLIL
jgi:hypothetical protein